MGLTEYIASELPSSVNDNLILAKKSKSKKKRKKKSKSRSKKSKTKRSATSQKSRIAISGQAGYEALFGNGVGAHFGLTDWLDLQGGIGYTLTGVRLGVGPEYRIVFSSKFSMGLGVVFGWGAGTTSKATIEGNVTDESTGVSSAVKSSREYELSSYTYASPSVSGEYFLKSFSLFGGLNFIAILSGNEVVFTGPIQYDTPVEPTNSGEADELFKEKAAEEVQAGGVGFTAGIKFYL